ncbi:MAG TPA: glycosyltransferase family 2 protein [Terracidiphilus sp.]|nr:glycosyltransferase family 2 protein [Terracidiphilus sp.]
MGHPEAVSIGLVAVSWLYAAAWLWQGWIALRGMPTLPDLTRTLPHDDASFAESASPDLSVIVPACNEAESIEASLRSLLASQNIRLEILAVNDRSTDATGEIIDRVAAENAGPHPLRAIHIEELPAGWLGKPHAMATAAAQASAEWLLFTDGDVIFAPDALERALCCALENRADHFVLVPTLIVHSMAERALQAAMQVLAQWTIRLWKVGDPKARDFVGVGGFNLIRRAAYRAVGGFESMPMEVLDDLRMGWKLKRAGFRAMVALGPDLVRIRWIAGVLSVFKLIEKNSFATFRFRSILHVLAAVAMTSVALVPLAAVLAGWSGLPHSFWIAAGGWAAWAGIILTYLANRKLMQAPVWLAVFFAPCVLLVAVAFVRSMVLALVRGGIRWRGTYYPLELLREHCGKW